MWHKTAQRVQTLKSLLHIWPRQPSKRRKAEPSSSRAKCSDWVSAVCTNRRAVRAAAVWVPADIYRICLVKPLCFWPNLPHLLRCTAANSAFPAGARARAGTCAVAPPPGRSRRSATCLCLMYHFMDTGQSEVVMSRLPAAGVRAWPFVDPSQAKWMDGIFFFPRCTESVEEDDEKTCSTLLQMIGTVRIHVGILSSDPLLGHQTPSGAEKRDRFLCFGVKRVRSGRLSSNCTSVIVLFSSRSVVPQSFLLCLDNTL